MKSLLDYHLNLVNHAITFQIVEQDEKISSFLKKVKVFTAKNGWRVMTSKRPEVLVNEKIIYLRGSKEQYNDDIVRIMGLGNEKEVKKIGASIDQALLELVEAASNKGDRRPFALVENVLISSSLSDLTDIEFNPTVIVVRKR